MKYLLLFVLVLFPFATIHAQQNGIEQNSELLIVPPGDKFLRFFGESGRSYFFQVSDANNPLAKWFWAPVIEAGNDEEISYEVDGTPDRAFFRLKYIDQTASPGLSLEDSDFDNDGLSNIDEIDPPAPAALRSAGPLPTASAGATDPTLGDSDGDGMGDKFENDNGSDPNNSDEDGNGIPDGQDDPDGDGTNNAEEEAGGTDPDDGPAGDSDNDGLSNLEDAVPTDAAIDWKTTADPRFAVIDLITADAAAYQFVDVSEDGTTLFSKNAGEDILNYVLVDKNRTLHVFPRRGHRHDSPVGEFVSYCNALFDGKVFGSRLVPPRISEQCLWDPVANTYTPHAFQGYHDGILDVRGDLVVDTDYLYPYTARLKTGNMPLQGSDNWKSSQHARIERNGNVVAYDGYWRYDSETSSHGNVIPREGATHSATLTQGTPATDWNLLIAGNHLHISRARGGFTESDVVLPEPHHLRGTTHQGWIATNNEIWANGRWRTLAEALPGPAATEVTLLGILDTGLGVARIQPATGAEKIVLLVPVDVVEVSPKTRDADNNEIAGSERPSVGTPLTPLVEENPVTNKIAHRELKVRINEALKGKTVTWTFEPVPGAIPAAIRGHMPASTQNPSTTRNFSPTHPDRFEASAAYGANGFTRLSQTSGKTTVSNDGITAIRVNVPPIGFNQARIRIQIEGIAVPVDLIDMEVPGVVVIDPGHGGTSETDFINSTWNNSTSPSGVLEKTMALSYGLELNRSLKAHSKAERLNLKVLMTRTTDISVNSRNRANIARDNGADQLFIIHFNAFTDDDGEAPDTSHTARGTLEVRQNPNLAGSLPQDIEFIDTVLDQVVPAMQPFDAGSNRRGHVFKDTTVATDLYMGNEENYHFVRAGYCEVEFIDFGAQTPNDQTDDDVDILLNTGPNAAAIKIAIANAMCNGIIQDMRNQPRATP